ncbi:hypothetical protein OEZ86_003220 [Tetradesmus obliquus]|nr:hypothetical protein OEZ86_003220 [Tetradesmus obliquus]
MAAAAAVGMGSGAQEPATTDAAGVSVEAIKANTAQLGAACVALKAQREARAVNLEPKRPGESDLGRLDSSIKKNGAFIKKLRGLGADNRQQLLAEAAKLNLSKYVSEAVAALAEVPLKTSDVPAAVDMAAALHARYPDFAASLGPAIAKVAVGGSKGAADDDRLAARRQRGALRLLPELLAAGVLADATGLLGVMKTLVTALDFSKEKDSSLHNATLLGGLAKSAAPLLLGALPEGAAAAAGSLLLPQELLHAEDLSSLPGDLAAAVAELQQQQKQLEAEMQQRYQLPPEQRSLLLKMFDRAFDCCCAELVESHKALLALDRENARAYATKGELPEGAAAEYESCRKAYEGLHRAVAAMAEALDKQLPDLAEDAFTRLDEGSAAGATGAPGAAADAIEHIFEDPEVRAFYEQLPDLWSLLLPYYARVAATIAQAYPEVGAGLLAAVEAEFDATAAKKDLTRMGEEPRLRVARYLAELAKFRLAPPSAVLLRLKALLDDFSGPAVDAAATLVENAGRFLLRLPESKVRMENLLGVMMRLRNARNLDSRQTNAVDSAYFACRPPDKATQRRRRPPLQEYIRHLLFEVLGDGSIVEVLRKLMKLPWGQAEPYLLKCLLKVSRVRFQHIALIASLAGGLAQYHDSLGVGLVDLVLEDVRWGMDHPAQGNYQQRLAQVGEAYNYMLLDSRAVFDVLYMLIGHAHDNEEAALKLDPPDDFFRIRLVIALLSTCGSYFSKGAAGRRLDRFLTFMQAYVAAKQQLPLDVEADLQDLYNQLRPRLVQFSSYAEAAAAVSDILAKEAAATASGLEPIEEEESDEEEERGGTAAAADAAAGLAGTAEDDDEDGEVGSGDGLDEYERGDEQGLAAAVDDEFEREYSSLLQECQGRSAGPAPAAAAAAPSAAPGPSSSSSSSQQVLLQRQPQQPPYHVPRAVEAEGYDDESAAPAVTLKLLMKKGGKDDRSRELHVPANAAIAVRLMAQQQSEAAEREQIKALVLEANLRDEAEQQAAAVLAAQRTAAATGRRPYRGGSSRGHHGAWRRML